jgi:hypothetical protein
MEKICRFGSVCFKFEPILILFKLFSIVPNLKSEAMLILAALLFAVSNFSRGFFTSTSNSSTSPFLILPYFDKQSPHLARFEQFSDGLLDRPSLATVKLDCLASMSACSLYRMRPDRLYISIPPHGRRLRQSDRPLTTTGLAQLAWDILNNNIRTDLSSLDAIKDAAESGSLFLLAARSNAGDLEEKLPIFESIAMEFLSQDVAFALVTDPILYERFSKFPLTSLSYVPPSLNHVVMTGEFVRESVRDFVERHKLAVFGRRLSAYHVSLMYLGDELPPSFYQQAQGLQGVLDLAFVNRSEAASTFAYFCRTEPGCAGLVDAKSLRFVKIGQNFTEQAVLEKVAKFDELWLATPFQVRIIVQLRMMGFLRGPEAAAASLCAVLWAALVFLYVLEATIGPRKSTG